MARAATWLILTGEAGLTRYLEEIRRAPMGETADGRFAVGAFYGNRTKREGRCRQGANRRDVWSEPSLDNP